MTYHQIISHENIATFQHQLLRLHRDQNFLQLMQDVLIHKEIDHHKRIQLEVSFI